MTIRTVQLCLLCITVTTFMFVTLGVARDRIDQRVVGAIVIDGEECAFLQGKLISNIQVYAAQQEHFVAVPFQIDERDRRGRWVITSGPRTTQDSSPGIFDSNDAITILHKHAGRRTTPNGDGVPWYEVTLELANNTTKYVYVRVAPQAKERALPHPVSYDEQRDRVHTRHYGVAFDTPLPNHLSFDSIPGKLGANVISGTSLLAEVSFLKGLLKLQRTETDIRSRHYGHTNGPVRLIRRGRYWFPLPFGFRATGRVDLIFYSDFVEGTALVKVKIPPRLILADGRLRVSFDFLDFGKSRLVLPEDDNTFDGSTRWAAITLPSGESLLLVTHMGSGLSQLKQRPHFTRPQLPLIGNPSFGFDFSEVSRLQVGTHRISVFGVLLPQSDMAAIQNAAKFFLTTPRVSWKKPEERPTVPYRP